jgi:hypothetical protein
VDRGRSQVRRAEASGFAGTFTDKEWMEVDTYPNSLCSENVYVAHTSFTALEIRIMFSRSSDGGVTFSKTNHLYGGSSERQIIKAPISPLVGWDGLRRLQFVRRSSGRRHLHRPVNRLRRSGASQYCGQLMPPSAWPSASDLCLRGGGRHGSTPSTSRTEPVRRRYDVTSSVQSTAGSPGRAGAVNEDGERHQIFPPSRSPTACCVAWYDFATAIPTNEALDVSPTQRLPPTQPSPLIYGLATSHSSNCLMFGGGTAAFPRLQRLDAYWNGNERPPGLG